MLRRLHFPQKSRRLSWIVIFAIISVDEVVLGGASVIVKVAGRDVSITSDLDFSLSDIADVFPSGALGALRSWLAALFRKCNRL